uniref:Transposase (putative) gypsy type domain-containing protein n=1 Tax=Fagus sylvatica TaxID=28930 RepID=A0A2N9EZW6_FAGSY
MATDKSDWLAVLFEELPEGLSLSGRESEEVSSEVTTSTRAPSKVPRTSKRWVAYSYFSCINIESLKRIRSRYQVPGDVVLRIPNLDERACSHTEDVTFYESTITAGLRFPVQSFIRELLDFLSLALGQVAPNGWRVIISSMVMWRECSDGLDDITVEEFLYCFESSQIAASPGFWTFRNRDNAVKLVEGLPSSNRGWKDGYFFVCGDNWERLPEESDDYVRIRKTWGTPSSASVSLTRLTLSQVWRDCVLRAHHLTNRGPVMTTSLKRKKTDEWQSSIFPGLLLKKVSVIPTPLPVLQTPPIVQISDEKIAVVQATDDGSTICRSHGLAATRAKAAITELDFQEYANAQMKNISKLMVHSIMRKDAFEELEKAKVDLSTKDGDIKAVMEAQDGTVKEMKHLMGQIEGARAAAVSEYQSFEVFEDNNLRFFYSGFEAFRKQAMERYPDVDFSAFQPYDDTESINDDGAAGGSGDQDDAPS